MDSNQHIQLWRVGSIVLFFTISLILPLSGIAQSEKETPKKKEVKAIEQPQLPSMSTSNAAPAGLNAETERASRMNRVAADKKAEEEVRVKQERMKAKKESNAARYEANLKIRNEEPVQEKTENATSDNAGLHQDDFVRKRQAYEKHLRSSGKSEAAIQRKRSDFEKLNQPRK